MWLAYAGIVIPLWVIMFALGWLVINGIEIQVRVGFGG